MSKKLGSSAIYLIEEQYYLVKNPKSFDIQHSSAFRALSKKKRLCHGKVPEQKYDADGLVCMSKHKVRAGVMLITGRRRPSTTMAMNTNTQNAT
jgi:hypothetical protein